MIQINDFFQKYENFLKHVTYFASCFAVLCIIKQVLTTLKSKNMEKQVELREAKSVDVQSVVAGVSVLICMLAAVLGYESLSICSVMIFAVVCVMGGMVKDWVEFCRDLVDEEWYNYHVNSVYYIHILHQGLM